MGIYDLRFFDLRFPIAFSDLLILSFPLGGAVVSTRWYRSDISPERSEPRIRSQEGWVGRASARPLPPRRFRSSGSSTLPWRWRPRHRICLPAAATARAPSLRGQTTHEDRHTLCPLPTTIYPLPSTFLHFLPVTCLTVILIDIPVRSAGGGLHGLSRTTPIATGRAGARPSLNQAMTKSPNAIANHKSQIVNPHYHLPAANCPTTFPHGHLLDV